MNQTDDRQPWWADGAGPESPADALPSARSAPAEAPEPLHRFCPVCGAPWDPAWTDCPLCRARAESVRAAAAKAQPGSIGSAMALYFVLLACSAAGIVAVTAGAGEVTVEIVDEVVSVVLILAWAASQWGRLRSLLGTVGPAWAYLLAPCLGACTFGAAHLSTQVFRGMVPILSYSEPILDAGYGWGAVFLMICVQPAIFEEIAFRGVILEALKGPLSLRDAVIVSAMMFMILHLTPLSFPFLLLLGLATAWVRLKSGSLYPCMVLHATHNFLCILMEMRGG